ncbi:MAG: hypothetical protein ACNYVW_03515 [Methanosarcinales archaeon]
MTATIEMIPRISPYTVGVTGDFTKVAFDWYIVQAEADLARDNPGLPDALADEAVCNLICDRYAGSRGGQDMKSEKIGDYSYTKDGSGKTSYRTRYEAIIAQFSRTVPTTGATRGDASLPPEFKFDSQPVRTFGDE